MANSTMAGIGIMQLTDRQVNTCSAPLSWYVCRANSFTGCCSVDPCDLPGCPDVEESPSPSPSPTPTPVRTTAAPNPATSDEQPVTITVVPSASTSSVSVTVTTQVSSSSSSSSPSSTDTTSQRSTLVTTTSGSSTSSLAAPASTVSASEPAAASEISDGSSDSVNKTAIIAGVVGGVAGIILLACIFFLLRRRKKQAQSWTGQDRHLSLAGGNEGQGFLPTASEGSSSLEKSWRKSSADMFADFGGLFRNQNHKRSPPPPPGSQIHNHPECLVPGARPSARGGQNSNSNDDIVPNLDSTPIMPTTELEGTTPAPCELSGEEKKQQEQQQQSQPKAQNQAQNQREKVYLFRPHWNSMRGNMEAPGGHVMSWAEYDPSSPANSTASASQTQKNQGGTHVSPLIEGERWTNAYPPGTEPVSPELGR